MLADCGVCIIGNVDSCKKDTREVLQKGMLKLQRSYALSTCVLFLALETNQIVLSLPRQLEGATVHDLSWKLNCTVWAHVDQQSKKKPFVKADSDAIKDLSLHVSFASLVQTWSFDTSSVLFTCINTWIQQDVSPVSKVLAEYVSLFTLFFYGYYSKADRLHTIQF